MRRRKAWGRCAPRARVSAWRRGDPRVPNPVHAAARWYSWISPPSQSLDLHRSRDECRGRRRLLGEADVGAPRASQIRSVLAHHLPRGKQPDHMARSVPKLAHSFVSSAGILGSDVHPACSIRRSSTTTGMRYSRSRRRRARTARRTRNPRCSRLAWGEVPERRRDRQAPCAGHVRLAGKGGGGPAVRLGYPPEPRSDKDD